MSTRQQQRKMWLNSVQFGIFIGFEGNNFNTDQEEAIRAYLDPVRPDGVVYPLMCGAHNGHATFPSRIAKPLPGLVGDPPAVLAQVCREKGIPFGAYIPSFGNGGPMDRAKWMTVDAEGHYSNHRYCHNGPWLDEYLLPFVFEVIERYDPDLIWFDGVYDAYICYCEHCLRLFHQREGKLLSDVLVTKKDVVVRNFYETTLLKAIDRTGQAIHKRSPKLTVTWSPKFTFMAGQFSPPDSVDWVSADCLNKIEWDIASLESNYLSLCGKLADIIVFENGVISWSPYKYRPKTLANLKTEFAVMLANGLRAMLWQEFSTAGQMIAPRCTKLAQSVAEFVRARLPFCIGNEPIAEVAVLASMEQRKIERKPEQNLIRGMYQILREGHLPCHILRDDMLVERLNRYRLVIIPQMQAIAEATVKTLQQFVSKGGRLLIIGSPALSLRDLIGGNITVDKKNVGMAKLGEEAIDCKAVHYCVVPTSAKALTYCVSNETTFKSDGRGLLWENRMGKGSVLFLAADVITEFLEAPWPPLRELILDAIHRSMGQPSFVEIQNAPVGVQIIVNSRSNDLLVHLVNHTMDRDTAPPCRYIEDVPEIHDVIVHLYTQTNPEKVTIEPGNREVQFIVKNGRVSVKVPPLKFHLAVKFYGILMAVTRESEKTELI